MIQEIKKATAEQIIGDEPMLRGMDSNGVIPGEIDWQSVEKAVKQIKNDMCYAKHRGIFREPTSASVRTRIHKLIASGKLKVAKINDGRAKRNPKRTMVDPSEVRVAFLSLVKYDLKDNQPGWLPPQRDSSRKKAKKIGLFKTIINYVTKFGRKK